MRGDHAASAIPEALEDSGNTSERPLCPRLTQSSRYTSFHADGATTPVRETLGVLVCNEGYIGVSVTTEAAI